ncbi:bifunctional metallophosphatase/5'-nucleotidase [Aquincola sp. S2]|uniref:Bifunctional metallophosphatase/5'-nucleotidase n=1 Tax=Pseudaquabacterium terrae TaxID=2732868 RepID=A0ABX2EKR1_9BURK|nr:bifunctional metallophosphatase/5'-nucleotidase [Aquabacterium terrae]NRF69227.1 bifunctional metallophosphatase/5'-nucleotidase [Aquabacterium terrae]
MRFARRRFRLATGAFTASLAAVLAGCSTAPIAPPQPVQPVQPVQLRVIGFNDFHGHLEPSGMTLSLPDPAKPGATQRVTVGGAAAFAGLVNRLRAGSPHSVVVSSGDMIGGAPLVSTLFRHESTIEVMNRMGVEVGAPGNHEFDAGSVELQRVLAGGCGPNPPGAMTNSCALQPYAGARFQLVAANVERADGAHLLAPSWVKQVGPVKVGFIGAVTRWTPGIVVPSGVAGLRFVDEAEAINRAAAALKAQGVHTLVVTMHEGGEIGGPQQAGDWNDERCPGLRGPIVDLAKRITPDVDLILTGHSHQGYRCVVDGRPIIQSFSYSRALSATDLFIDPKTGRVDRAATRSRNLPVFNEHTEAAQRTAIAAAQPAPWDAVLRDATPDAAVAQQVAVFSAAAAPRTLRVVGRIAGSFERGERGKGDSAAGRLIADAQWAATRAPAQGGAQLALMNPGGIRSDLHCRGTPPCAVTFGDVFTMQPFGNSLVVMSFSGAELKALLESQQPPGRAGAHLLHPSASLRYRWVASAPHGQRVQDLSIDGTPLRPEATYRVTVNSYLAEGGDGFTLLKTGRDRLGGAVDLDALLEYLRTTTLAPVAAPRITWVD